MRRRAVPPWVPAFAGMMTVCRWDGLSNTLTTFLHAACALHPLLALFHRPAPPPEAPPPRGALPFLARGSRRRFVQKKCLRDGFRQLAVGASGFASFTPLKVVFHNLLIVSASRSPSQNASIASANGALSSHAVSNKVMELRNFMASTSPRMARAETVPAQSIIASVASYRRSPSRCRSRSRQPAPRRRCRGRWRRWSGSACRAASSRS